MPLPTAFTPEFSPRRPCWRLVAGHRRWLCVVAGVALTGTGLVAALPAPAQMVTSAPAGSLLEPSPAELYRLVLIIGGQSDPQARVEAALSVLEFFSDEGVKALLIILESKNNDAAKLAVCQAISQAQSTHPDFVPPLMGLLDHKEAAIREAAAAALAGYDDPVVTARLKEQERQLLEKTFIARCKQLHEAQRTDSDRAAQLQRWLKSTLALDRLTALEIVHEKMVAGTRPAPDILYQIRQMLTDREPRVRKRAVIILRDMRQSEDSPRVQAMLATERLPDIRREIYGALGYLADPGSIPACVAGLREPDEQVAAEAAAALGRLAARTPGAPPPETDLAVTALVERASEPMDSDIVREQIIEAMARIADPQFLPIFRAHAGANERVPAIRQAALRGIGLVGDLRDAEVVIERMERDPDAGVREFAADALGKIGSRPEHLERLRGRLDPKEEPSVAVQNKAWESYKQLFLKILPPAEREQVLSSWSATDPVTVGRRIDLLAEAEKQMSPSIAEPQRLGRVRELLGDAYLSAGRGGDAAGAFTRVLEVLPATDQETAQRVAGKLVEAHLRASAPEKAILFIQESKPQRLRETLIARLLEYVRLTGTTNRTAAISLLDKLNQMAPDRFGKEWARQFDELRASLSATTQPVATRPG